MIYTRAGFLVPDHRLQALNPGNFVTNLQQNMSKMELTMFVCSRHGLMLALK
jgi:hypothetical protein